MYDLPTIISVGDKDYAITNNGDFRMVLDCFSALGDIELGEDYRVLASLIIFYDDFDEIDDIPMEDEELVRQLIFEMYNFFSCGQQESTGTYSPKLIDWEQDSQIIMSAVNNVAQKEIRLEPYVHWWTFVGYYMAVGQSVLSTVVSIRDKILRGKKLEKWEQEFRRENPHYFNWNSKTLEEQELDEIVKQMWNSSN